jgi:hypothetical protein
MEDESVGVVEAAHTPPSSFPAFPSLSQPTPPAAPAAGSPAPASHASLGLAALLPDATQQMQQLQKQQIATAAEQVASIEPVRVKLEEELFPALETACAPQSENASNGAELGVGAAAAAVSSRLEAPEPRRQQAPPAAVPVATATPTKRKAASKKSISNEPAADEQDANAVSSARKKKRAKHVTSDAPNLAQFAHPSSALAAAAAAQSAAASASAAQPASAMADDFELEPQLPLTAKRPHSRKKAAGASSNHRPSAAMSDAAPPHAAAAASSDPCGGAADTAPAPSQSSTSGSAATECIICQSATTSHGPHRLCCIKCGHLFGQSCIKSWLVTHKQCPICKLKAAPGDIIKLFVNAVAVADTAAVQTERDRVQSLLNELMTIKGQHAALQHSHKKVSSGYPQSCYDARRQLN